MKRRISFLMISIIIPTFLTSCRVNWFGEHYDVPWWVIAIPAAILIFVTWLIGGKCISSKTYTCAKCNKSFHPAWWNAVFSVHIGNARVFKCPHCKYKGFSRISKE